MQKDIFLYKIEKEHDCLEKEMITHSSILAWKIPWSEEPGGLQSMGSQESNLATDAPQPHYV